jgi:hypothetical protein
LQQQINLIRRFLSNVQTPDSVITHPDFPTAHSFPQRFKFIFCPRMMRNRREINCHSKATQRQDRAHDAPPPARSCETLTLRYAQYRVEKVALVIWPVQLPCGKRSVIGTEQQATAKYPATSGLGKWLGGTNRLRSCLAVTHVLPKRSNGPTRRRLTHCFNWLRR